MPLFPSTAMAITCFLVLVATLFFWLSAFSTPYIHSIWYIHLRGDAFNVKIIDNTHLTGSLILVALTAGFGTIAFFSLLHSLYDLVSGGAPFFLVMFTSFLSTISTLLVLICWGVAHHRFARDNLDPRYGAAFILVIIGWLLYLLAIPFALIGWIAIRRDRAVIEKRRWRA